MDLADSYRILQGLVHDLASSSEGLSTGEIVRAYRISRRLVPKYIGILEAAGVPIYTDRKRYYLDESYFSAFTLSADESELLLLALERSLVFHSTHSSALRSLLLKLSNKMLEPLADFVKGYLDQDRAERPFDRWFSELAEAKRKRHEVWVTYHPLNRPYESRWLIRPYRFLSNPLSDGLYIHCQGSRDGKQYIPLSLRLDRIVDVQPTNRSFGIAEMAEFTTYAGLAWGVWRSEKEPVTVRLRFEPRHYDRLLETVWHPTQQLRVELDGYVTFTVEVTEPDEMIPWIRSWGSGIVVLEPNNLRQRIIRTLKRQMEAYGIVAAPSSDDLGLNPYLWAKYDRVSGSFHRLDYHLLDVAAVALSMWDTVFSSTTRTWVATLLGLDEDGARRTVALLAGIHDIGKATPGFQGKAAPLYERLLSAGMPNENRHDKPHGILSAVIVVKLFDELGVAKRVSTPIALAIGGHHGRWISSTEFQSARRAVGGDSWLQIQRELLQRLFEALGLSSIQLPLNTHHMNAFIAFMSGFVSVCDWIGSNDTYFPFEKTEIAIGDYWERARAQSEVALTETGWLSWQKSASVPSFSDIFPPLTPNALQQAGIAYAHLTDYPYKLVLIEYLTGGGKTELALYLADQWINQFDLAGVYVAMPTQATSNQMFERVSRYLENRYPNQSVNLQLVHAQSDQHPLYQAFLQRPEREGDESQLAAESWFQNHKRALLAPFAVGTVDQAMLGVLQAKHHFVRQYGLSHKVVLFDEIHAYDTYMNEIIDRLIVWLDTLSSPMIMLSATLPRSSRRRLLKQVGAAVDMVPEIPYPRLTIVNHDNSVQVHPLPAPPARLLHLRFIEPQVESFIELVANVYEKGGIIAVICNTVDEAIEVARKLHESAEFDPDDILVFHARFPAEWRNQTEHNVLSMFGKTGSRPHRAILVATQIVEQSLDLDFDLIVTSTAPIDLLIQRAGRLHRHKRADRPEHLRTPTLWIRQPLLNANGLPDFGVDEAIYSRYLLLKTWLLIHQKNALELPTEIDSLMEFVYDLNVEESTTLSAYQAALHTAKNDLEMDTNRSAFRGAQYRIGTPDDEALLDSSRFDLTDDEYTTVSTREIRRSIDIICVRGTDGDRSLPVLPTRKPTQDELAILMRFRVTISKAGITESLERLPENSHWARIPKLRRARAISLTNGIFRTPDGKYILSLSRQFGLEITEA